MKNAERIQLQFQFHRQVGYKFHYEIIVPEMQFTEYHVSSSQLRDAVPPPYINIRKYANLLEYFRSYSRYTYIYRFETAKISNRKHKNHC